MKYSDKNIKVEKEKLLGSFSRNNGFTLMEIITVVIIVGVLAGLSLPRFGGTLERMKTAEGVHMLTALLGAQKAYQFEYGSFATDPDDLDVEITTAKYFNVPPSVGAGPVASLTRTGGYTLHIAANGVITCTEGGAITCAQAGY